MMKMDIQNSHAQRAVLVVVAVFAAVTFAACGTSGPAPLPTATPAPPAPATEAPPAPATEAPPAPATEAPPATQAPTGESVIVESIAFRTNELTVPVGSTVSWDNRDSVPHTVTHGTAGTAEDSPLFDIRLPVGQQVSYTFEQAGTFPVTCTIHPAMQMSVTVE